MDNKRSYQNDQAFVRNVEFEDFAPNKKALFNKFIRNRDWGTQPMRPNILIMGQRSLGQLIAQKFLESGVNSIIIMGFDKVGVLKYTKCVDTPNRLEFQPPEVNCTKDLISNYTYTVETESTPIQNNDDLYFHQFDFVICTEFDETINSQISEKCRQAKVKLFIANEYYNFFYTDLYFEHSLYGDMIPNNLYVTVSFEKDAPPFDYYIISAMMLFQKMYNSYGVNTTCDQDKEILKTFMQFKEDECPENIKKFYDYLNTFCLFFEKSSNNELLSEIILEQAMTSYKNPNKDIMQFNIFYYNHVKQMGKFYLLKNKSNLTQTIK